MDETMNQIHRLATQRLDLYRLAGKQPLIPAQRDRLQQLDNQLPVLWDQYRRELATETRNRETRSRQAARAA